MWEQCFDKKCDITSENGIATIWVHGCEQIQTMFEYTETMWRSVTELILWRRVVTVEHIVGES